MLTVSFLCTYNDGGDVNFLPMYISRSIVVYHTPWYVYSGGGGFAISTSFLGYTRTFGGCAAMVDDGYGTFYSVDDNRSRYV